LCTQKFSRVSLLFRSQCSLSTLRAGGPSLRHHDGGARVALDLSGRVTGAQSMPLALAAEVVPRRTGVGD